MGGKGRSAYRRRFRGRDGGVSTFVVVMTLPMLMTAALAYDGGQILTARRQANDIAQQAALAGVQGLSGTSARSGHLAADPSAVNRAALDYLSRAGYEGQVRVGPTAVEVEVAITVEMEMLSLIGVRAKTVTGQAEAQVVRGVDNIELRQGTTP